MEFTNEQIAKLVLGYLKSEGCKYAAKYFIKASPYLKKICSDYKNLRFSTRVGKWTLVDFLTEYSKIYTIVQDKLEYTSYYQENKHKLMSTQSLTDDLLYLFDNYCKNSDTHSLATTPQRDTPNNLSEGYSDISNDNVKSSALEDLPGYDVFKTKLRNCIQEKRGRELHTEPDLSILTQTLLDSHELHEKIAENINFIRNSGEDDNLQSTVEVTANASHAVDTAIKAIVEKTENDPIYEKLISEIIGVTNENQEDNLFDQKSSTEEKCKSDSECYKKPVPIISLGNKSDTRIEHQNIEMVQTVFATESCSNYTKTQQQYFSTPITKRTDLKNCLNVYTETSDVIFYDGNLENYMKSSNANASNNLLMVKPKTNNTQVQTTPSISAITSVASCNNINGQSIDTTSNVITEEDIIKMPTVILCENAILEPPMLIPVLNTPSSGLREYITMYKGSSDSPKFKNVIVDDIPSSSLDFLNTAPSRSQLEEIAKKYIKNRATVKLSVVPAPPSPTSAISANTSTAKNTIQNVTNMTTLDTKRPSTPITPQDASTNVDKENPTPKSSESHVRVLDFNFTSPGKESVDRKNDTNKSKCVQSLFGSDKPKAGTSTLVKPTLVKTAGSWDADLRALAMSSLPATVSDVTKTKKPLPKKKPKGTKDTVNEVKATKKKGKKDKKTKLPKKISKADAEAATTDIDNTTKEKSTSMTTSTENGIVVTDTGNVGAEVETTIDLKDKSNNHSSTKPIQSTSKTPDSKFNKKSSTKSTCAIVEIDAIESNAKFMLSSPTKLNANKRNLLDVDKDKCEGSSVKNNNNQVNDKKPEDILLKESNSIFGMNVQDVDNISSRATNDCQTSANMNTDELDKRNVSFTVVTPVKGDVSVNVPKTPGMFSPLHLNDTPFTKVFKEHMKGIDICDISTPKFPLTPCIPVTPLIDDTNFPNRPTDYSTSSSYYQPSDTEENKYLELKIIAECNKTGINDNKSAKNKKKKCANIPDTNAFENKIDEMIAETMKTVSCKKNAKNLCLLKNEDVLLLTTSESDLSSSSSSCSCIDSNYSKAEGSGSSSITISPNNTVIAKPKAVDLKVGGYLLRNTPSRFEKELRKSDEKLVEVKQTTCNQVNKIKLTQQKTILKEMEEKRQKTIMSIMNIDSKKPAPKKSTRTALRKGCGKLSKATAQKETSNKMVLKKTSGNQIKELAKTLQTKSPLESDKLKPLESDKLKPLESDELKPLESDKLKPLESDKLKPLESDKLKPLEPDELKPPELEKTCNPNDEINETNTKFTKLVTALKERDILLIPNLNTDVPTKKDEKPQQTRSKNRRKSQLPKKKIKSTTTMSINTIVNEVNISKSDIEKESIDIKKNDDTNVVNQQESVNNSTNLNVSECVTFDIKTYEQETLHVEYDENNTSKKTLADYDFTCIKKGITASVYLEELDCEIEKCMLPTSIEFITIPDKKCAGKTTEKSAPKRKASLESNEPAKKSKTDLIMNVQIEDFLNRVHGTE